MKTGAPPRNVEEEYEEQKADALYTPAWTLLANLYHDTRYTSPSKKRFYQLVSERYPEITYQDVSDFMNRKSDYQAFKKKLIQEKKFVGPRAKIMNKPPEKRKQRKTAIRVFKPNYKWQMDLTSIPVGVDKNGFKYIFTIIDVFTKYAFAIPIQNKKGETVANVLEVIFTKHGPPLYIQSDNGKEFIGPRVKEVMAKHKVTHMFNPAYEHLGIVERFNQTLKRMVDHTNAHSLAKWPLEELVKDCIEKYNHLPHSAHKYKPAELHFDPTPIRLWNARRIMMDRYNKGNDTVVPHPIGSVVQIHIRDWPDLPQEIKKAIHNEERTVGLKVLLQRYGKKEYDTYRVKGHYIVPKSNPPVHLYRVSSIPSQPGEQPKDFDKWYTHQQLGLLK